MTDHLDLIQRSIAYNEIAHADHSDDLALDLLIACDDWVASSTVSEYWGTTENGEEWRVHLHGAA
jgi:hypothetical protein